MYLILCFKSVFAFIFSIIVSKKRLNPCVSLHECRRVFHASIFTLRLALPTKARLLSIFSLESLYPWSKIVQVFSHSKICFFHAFFFCPTYAPFHVRNSCLHTDIVCFILVRGTSKIIKNYSSQRKDHSFIIGFTQ